MIWRGIFGKRGLWFLGFLIAVVPEPGTALLL